MDEDFDIDDAVLMEAANQVDRHLEATKPNAAQLQCLQTNFGHSEFRPKQWDIIRSIVEEKRDNCVIMPTGYGKSLCFQFPAVYANGITLVVSPLISLMQDQVSALSVANIPACFLGSAQTDRNIESQVIAGDFRMVYSSPEYLNGDRGHNLLKKLESRLTLVAIDESHCISAFGHAFRPEYRKLGFIRKEIPSVPILAVTATATQHVRDDIISSLCLKDTQCVSMGFDRPNIHFSFRNKTKNVWDELKPFVTNVRGSVIVYVLTKNGSEDIARILRMNDVNCEIYHAGLSMSKRRNVLDDFIKDRLRVIVATVAFGMGIDKPDVRCVIHYGASKNIESYYQEVGRAGRDGQPSKAITFHEKADFGLHEWFLSDNREHQSETVIKHLRDIGQKMRDLCHTTMCRRKYLLEYFGSEASHIRPRKNCCDNCDNGSSRITLSDTYEGIDNDGNYDFSGNGFLLLKAMQITNKVAVAISVLRGSSEKKALEFQNEKEIYGRGKIWPKDYWSRLVEQLKDNDFITIKKLPLPYRPIQVISVKGVEWLKKGPGQRMILKAKPEMYPFFKKKKKIFNALEPSTSNKPPEKVQEKITKEAEKIMIEDEDDDYQVAMEMSDKHLEEILLGIRAVLAENSDCMPYLVASNIAITQMVEKKPVSIKEFKSCIIDGFSIAKIDKFASFFIDGVIKFMNNKFCMSSLLCTYPLNVKKSILSTKETRRLQKLIRDNQSLSSICLTMSRSKQEIVDEIVIMIRTGFPITKSHLSHLIGVTDEMLRYFKSNVIDEDFVHLNNISMAKEKFSDNPHITEHMLSLVLNYLKIRQFLRSINVPFFDVDENRLVNGNALLKRECAIEKTNSSQDQSAKKTENNKSKLNDENPTNSQTTSQECSQKPTGSISSSQNSPSSKVSDLLKEDEDVFAAIIEKCYAAEMLGKKPLQDLQQSNQNNEIKKFEAKPPVKMSTSKTTTTAAKKRPAASSKYMIKYDTDSDSDSNSGDVPEPKTKRTLPQWLTTKKRTNTMTSSGLSIPVKKKPFF